MKRIAIIPARGGSKRIPRKNLVHFRGRPMISWTIKSALNSQLFSNVLVSTDDEETAQIARQEGAEVPFLRKDNFDDFSPVSLATLTALEQAVDFWGSAFDTVVQLMPNCPLRGPREIIEAVKYFEIGKHRFQISAFQFGWMNPWWACRIDADGQPTWLFPEDRMRRSQDLEKLYCPTGAIWVADVDALRESKSFYGPGHVLHPIPWDVSIDIDDFADLHMAEVIAEARLKDNLDNQK